MTIQNSSIMTDMTDGEFERKRQAALDQARMIKENPEFFEEYAEKNRRNPLAEHKIESKKSHGICEKHQRVLLEKQFKRFSIYLPCPECVRDREIEACYDRGNSPKNNRIERTGAELRMFDFPWRMIEKGLDGFQQATMESRIALEAIKAFISSFPATKSIVLLGDVGRGKSHLAFNASYQIAKKGFNIVMGSPGQLFAGIQSRFGKGGESDVEIDHILKTEFLLIDDLDKKPLGDWAKSVVFDILDYRMNHGKPMLITTNRDPEELRNFFGKAKDGTNYGDPIMSRLCDKEVCSWYRVTGIDWRREKLNGQGKGGAYAA